MNRYKCPSCGENQYSASGISSPCQFCGNPKTERMADIEENDMSKIIWKSRLVGGYRYKKYECECGRGKEIEIEHPVKLKLPYCGFCGKTLLDANQNYCGWCGKNLEEVVSSKEGEKHELFI